MPAWISEMLTKEQDAKKLNQCKMRMTKVYLGASNTNLTTSVDMNSTVSSS
jgi:hypothetical protein